jgi:hypothetical protein
MEPIFLELIFDSEECAEIGIDSRDEIEDGLEDALKVSGLGAVTGGSGMGKYNIDLDIFSEEKLGDAISQIRIFLASINVARSSKMVRYQPQKEKISVYV